MAVISREWAQFARKLRFEDLDAETTHSAKRFIYDSMGCALGATRKKDVVIAEEVWCGLGGVEQATIIGSGARIPVTTAAFINGLKVRAMDYNDIYWKADPTHPSDLISGPMAITEWQGRSGEDFLTAVVLAYELEMRMAECFDPGIRERGWHHATLTAFVSPVAAGMLMDLDEDQLVNAIGISGSHGCTLGKVVAGKLSNMKNTAEPFAVADGVFAALMAASGYSGPEEVLEGKEGLSHCMGPDWHPEILTEGLGIDPFRINQCSMKAFPTEALTHTPISAFITIMRDNGLTYQQIDSVLIKSIARAADILSDPAKYRPDSKETADHSLPYCLAAAAVDGTVTPGAFTDERLEDERIFSVIDKFKVVADPEFEKLFPEKQAVHVTVKTTDGKSFELRMDYPKGDPREPMTQEDLDMKFRALATGCMSDKRMDEIKAAIFDLDKAARLDELMGLLTADK
jgi:2-methylcitrate dehydratase